MCWPSPNSNPPLCHQTHLRITGSMNGSEACPASWAVGNTLRANPATAPTAPSPSVPWAESTRWIHW